MVQDEDGKISTFFIFSKLGDVVFRSILEIYPIPRFTEVTFLTDRYGKPSVINSIH